MNKKNISINRHLLWMLLTFGSPSAWALGLGNIELQSYLGEPLRASIALTDVSAAQDAGCFKLQQSTAGLPPSALNADIRLLRSAGGNARLTISAYQPLSEPIVNLTLMTDCESQIRRDYVLLLDPPHFHEPAADVPAVASVVTAPPPVAASRPQPSRPAPAATTSPHRTAAAAQRRKPRAAISDKTASARPAPSPQPRLVVSGGDEATGELLQVPLQLQLSTELGTWPEATDAPAMNATEVSDEVTAMAGRLAFLEAQIASLQQRNAELETLRTEAATLRAQQASSGRWLPYTLLVLLLAALIAVAEWLRRRRSQQQLATEMAIWDELAPEAGAPVLAATDDYTPAVERVRQPAADDGSAQAAAHFRVVDGSGSGGTGATVNEDILEQAEVFVAHGRTGLAIALLQDHLQEFPDLSPQPWLMLLDLLKRDGLATEYEIATGTCQRHFNVAIKRFDAPLAEDHSSIEDYPHIAARLEQVWGTLDALPYLDDLIFNRRQEARQGFEHNAYLELLLLRSIAAGRNLSEPAGDRGTVVPIRGRRSEESAAGAVTAAGMRPAESDDADRLFESIFETPELPTDKSKPLDFEIELRGSK